MNIHLIDIDSTIPNLALMKVKKYYEDKGHNVIENFPLLIKGNDKIFVSCIFKENRYLAEQYEGYPNVLIGGSGYDLELKLPEEIEKVKPRINLGFTTRGCIRKCGFCVVPKKEGSIKIEGDLFDLWDGKSKEVTLMDNNILAIPEHFKLICSQARKHKIKLDFNQGLDHRLLTHDMALELKKTSLSTYRFAYDNPSMRRSVNRAIALMKSVGINHALWYILVGYNTTLLQDIQRINHLRFTGQRTYIQRFDKKNRSYIPIVHWQNQKRVCNMTLMQFIEHPTNKYYKQWLNEYIEKVGLKALSGPILR